MKQSLPDGPRTPALVQMLGFFPRPFTFLERCARRYGDAFTMRLPGYGNIVMLGSPELVKQLFTAPPDTLLAGKANGFLKPALGSHSVLVTDGAAHRRQRRLLMPPLHGERMHAYAQVMIEETHAAIERMPLGEPFALLPYMQTIALQVILRAVFGLEAGAASDQIAPLLVEFIAIPNPLLTLVPLRFLDFPQSPYRAFIQRRARVDAALYAILAARRAPGAPKGEDILLLLLEAHDEEGRPMTDVELRDQMLTLLAAGQATTAAALSWVIDQLLTTPAAEERLRAELASVQQTHLEPPALASLTYLDAVLRETLRLRPIFTDVLREAAAPYEIAGHLVPAGTKLAAGIHLIHRRAELYPDPDEFRPERFIGAKVDPFAWLPFGGGSRRCLGMAFALYQMKIVLSIMMTRARFRAASVRPAKVHRKGITLAPAGGARVVLLERIAHRLRSPQMMLLPLRPGPREL